MDDTTKPNSPYAALLDKICVGLGYCGCIKDGKPLHVERILVVFRCPRHDSRAVFHSGADSVNLDQVFHRGLEPHARPGAAWAAPNLSARRARSCRLKGAILRWFSGAFHLTTYQVKIVRLH